MSAEKPVYRVWTQAGDEGRPEKCVLAEFDSEPEAREWMRSCPLRGLFLERHVASLKPSHPSGCGSVDLLDTEAR